MGSCRMGGSGPMGPGVSMGPMSASEAQTLPSNVISKQAGSMEVIITLLKLDLPGKRKILHTPINRDIQTIYDDLKTHAR